MQIKITGRGIDIGDSLREFATLEISNLIDKYIGDSIESSITIGKNNKLFNTEILLHISRGFIMKSNGSSDDPYKAVSLALERLESLIKKHKHRVKDKAKRDQWADSGYAATDYLLERRDPQTEESDEEHLVIAEREKFVLSLTVSEAVTKLDLGDLPVVMFKNADNNNINVVYKRPDGHIGWIDYTN